MVKEKKRVQSKSSFFHPLQHNKTTEDTRQRTMVKLELDVDPQTLFLSPQQPLQLFSLLIAKEREALLQNIRGMKWENSTTKGTVVDCTCKVILIQLPDGTRTELPVTKGRLTQLLAATTRK